MRLEIPINEVLHFINEQYRADIDLKVMSDDKIEVTYIDSLVLAIKEVKENVLFIHYELDGLAIILTGIARLFMKKKLAALSIYWNPKTKEISIDLKKIPKMDGFLKFAYVSEVHFVSDSIFLTFYARNKV